MTLILQFVFGHFIVYLVLVLESKPKALYVLARWDSTTEPHLQPLKYFSALQNRKRITVLIISETQRSSSHEKPYQR